MLTNLYQVLSENRPSLEDEIFLELSASSSLTNYHLGADLLRDRVASLVGAFKNSLKDDSDEFLSYVEAVAAERIDEGIVLHEMQLALQLLEEKVWQVVMAALPLKEQAHSLGQVALIIGTAKDRMADVYLHRLKTIESAVAVLRQGDNPLEMDPGAGPLTESDLNWQKGHVREHGPAAG